MAYNHVEYICTYCGKRVVKSITGVRPEPGTCTKKGKTKQDEPHRIVGELIKNFRRKIMSGRYMWKIILFTAIVATLAYVGSYIVPACELVVKIAILLVLIEIGYLVFIKLFGKKDE